jgi:hypothetical protein
MNDHDYEPLPSQITHSYFICSLLYDVMNNNDEELFDDQGFLLPDAHQRAHDWISRGAEPFWMQDIRCAQRRLERARRLSAGRSTKQDDEAAHSL